MSFKITWEIKTDHSRTFPSLIQSHIIRLNVEMCKCHCLTIHQENFNSYKSTYILKWILVPDFGIVSNLLFTFAKSLSQSLSLDRLSYHSREMIIVQLILSIVNSKGLAEMEFLDSLPVLLWYNTYIAETDFCKTKKY